MEYLSIRNWERYQHYSQRRPPWIKVYFSLLSEPEFYELSDASKLHTIAIMLLASQHENKLPFKKKWIADTIHANSRINWEEVLSTGMVICKQDASVLLASCEHDASPRAHAETTEKRREEYKSAEPNISDQPAAVKIPLNDKSEYSFIQTEIDEWSTLYPAVDILQELRFARGWCLSNPNKCKTRRGIRSFLNSWLMRQQDKYHNSGNGGKTTTQNSNRNLPKPEPPPCEKYSHDEIEKISGDFLTQLSARRKE